MIPQTPAERIACYEKAIEILEEHRHRERNSSYADCNGMCVILLDYICKEYLSYLSISQMMSGWFPELWEQKPVGKAEWESWYPHREIDKRIEHLQIAIKNVKL